MIQATDPSIGKNIILSIGIALFGASFGELASIITCALIGALWAVKRKGFEGSLGVRARQAAWLFLRVSATAAVIAKLLGFFVEQSLAGLGASTSIGDGPAIAAFLIGFFGDSFDARLMAVLSRQLGGGKSS